MFIQILISRVTLAAVAVLALSACQTLPQQPGVESAQAMPWDTSGPSVIPTSPLQQLDAAQTPTNEVAVAGIEAPADQKPPPSGHGAFREKNGFSPHLRKTAGSASLPGLQVHFHR